MQIIPAIDLKNGRCVRLVEGREASAKVYDRDPVDVAKGYERDGATLIHIVDLDGAFLGAASENQKIIRQIIEEISVPVEVGGGVRSLTDIENLINHIGARYVIIGTVAVEEPALVRAAVERFGEAIVVGIDARGREVATRGWTEATTIDAIDLAKEMVEIGVRRLIYTDITRDGKLEGVNVELTRELARASGAQVTASGGVASLDDIRRLCDVENDGVDSVIIGKALYENRFSVKEALAAAKQFAIQKSYDHIAQAYVEHIFDELKHKPFDRDLLDRFAKRMKDAERVCDLGCGPGHVTRYLFEQGVKICGIDLSPGMVEQARNLNPEIGFEQGNMLALDVKDATFDGLTAFYAIVNLAREELAKAY
jgi:phosphoribosylformimino-5-aminoimidazole carboxamide ribotide isomerase